MTITASHYYDSKKGWNDDKPGWYEVRLYYDELDLIKFSEKASEIIDWLYNNVGKCERHCRWTISHSMIFVKFRYQKDYTWFKLTWQ